jgi:branched-chain amino acid transport system ATP-binding protein
MSGDAALRLDSVTKDFGSVLAVDDVSFEIAAGETIGLIGPNGAGKTTLLNCICGILSPSSGEIYAGETAITTLEPYEVAAHGIARSFQINSLFPDFSVFENVRLAVQIHEGETLNMWRSYDAYPEHTARANEVIETIGLEDVRTAEVQTLAHGEKRLVELGIALASDPDVLLLDEPSAGLATNQISQINALIDDLQSEYTILLVEHNMDIIMDLSDSILVLNEGSLLERDTPEEIQQSEAVQQAYLGTDETLLGANR